MNWAGDVLRWGGVGAAVVAAHVAGVIWVDRAAQRSAVMLLPAPVFAELLPEPAAPEPPAEAAPAEESAAQREAQPEPEPTPEPEQAEAPEPEPVPDFEVPPLTELPPITDFAELVPESTLALTASARPKIRPEPPKPEPQITREERREPPNDQPKREPRRERAPQTQKAERAAPAENATAQKRGGPAQGQARASTGASKAQMDSWTSRVGGRVAAHMKRTRVPGGGRGAVTIQVAVSISGNGSASARVTSSTGNAQVDTALARQAGRMPRMPAPPNGKGASFVLPIRIDL